jgi:hypothetical protein
MAGGPDWPVCLLTASYAGVTSAARKLTVTLTHEEQALVLGGTAARVYRLPDCLLPERRPGAGLHVGDQAGEKVVPPFGDHLGG